MHETAAVETVTRTAAVAIRHTQLPHSDDRCLLADVESSRRLLLPGDILAATAHGWLIGSTGTKHAADQYGYVNVSKNPGCLRYHVTHPCEDITPIRLNST
jgi:hypothetical protein